METRIYYLPRNEMSKLAIQVVAIRVPCSFPEIRDMISSDVIKFKVTCASKNLPIVEDVLRRFEVYNED